MTAAIQFDWIDQMAAHFSDDDLAAIDHALLLFADGVGGRAASIRTSLLKHQAALLGLAHGGAAIPPDVRFRDAFTNSKLLSTCGPFHAWTICDEYMEMAGGHGATQQQAHAGTMVGLMLGINESARWRVL